VGALDAEEQTALRDLFLKEARKGAFRPAQDPSAIRAAFLDHVEREFQPATLLTVVDCLPYFRRKALEQAADPTPLASLILYAAWGEHWINVIITMGMLRSGRTDAEVRQFFATQPNLEAKIAGIRDLVHNPPPKKELDCLIQVMKTRNEYLHYTWSGRPQSAIDVSFKGIAALVRRTEVTLDGLLQYEHDEFDGPFLSLAATLFPAAR
jgi:hypothetical protein